MSWRNILKEDDDDKRKIKLGDRFQKPDGSVFIDGYGFKQKMVILEEMLKNLENKILINLYLMK